MLYFGGIYICAYTTVVRNRHLHITENDIVSHHMYIIMGYIILFFFFGTGSWERAIEQLKNETKMLQKLFFH